MPEACPPPSGEGPAAPSPAALVSALGRLDGQSRDLLEVSMRRRTPDDVLARLLRTDRREVARRRAGAIERLAEACGVRDVLGVGLIVRALLDPDVWSRFDGGTAVARRAGEAGGPPATPLARLHAARA